MCRTLDPRSETCFQLLHFKETQSASNSSISLDNGHVTIGPDPKRDFVVLLSSFFLVKCEQIPHDTPLRRYLH